MNEQVDYIVDLLVWSSLSSVVERQPGATQEAKCLILARQTLASFPGCEFLGGTRVGVHDLADAIQQKLAIMADDIQANARLT